MDSGYYDEVEIFKVYDINLNFAISDYSEKNIECRNFISKSKIAPFEIFTEQKIAELNQ